MNNRWISLITLCISTPKFSVIVNGEVTGIFDSGRGLRQGDPISSYLFILMVESLGRAFTRAKACPGMEAITHHQFVDDTNLIGKVFMQEAKRFKKILTYYEKASHQKINMSKTKIYAVNVSQHNTKQLVKIYNYQIGSFPKNYLGMSLFIGRMKKDYWEALLQKIRNKLSRWKEKILTYAVKLTLIKHKFKVCLFIVQWSSKYLNEFVLKQTKYVVDFYGLVKMINKFTQQLEKRYVKKKIQGV